MNKLFGAGLGLRQEFMNQLFSYPNKLINFLEIAPENWIKTGGKRLKIFEQYTKIYPIILHGLSLSIGGQEPLNISFIKEIKNFMDKYNIEIYSEHLSYCSDQQGYFYDLLPISFSGETIEHVVPRINQVQEIIERPLILENSSYYAAPNQKMSEIEFINAILKQSDCNLLLDVNNVYVNSINHKYNPYEFIKNIPSDKITYLHIAGHYQREPDLIIDTHGSDIIPEVWSLLEYTYTQHGVLPTLLERDFNIPDLNSLFLEIEKIKVYQNSTQLIQAK